MIAFLLTPIGKYIAIGAAILLLLSGVYMKIRSDATSDIQRRATADILERTKDAIRNGDSINLSPDRLRQPDGHNRD